MLHKAAACYQSLDVMHSKRIFIGSPVVIKNTNIATNGARIGNRNTHQGAVKQAKVRGSYTMDLESMLTFVVVLNSVYT